MMILELLALKFQKAVYDVYAMWLKQYQGHGLQTPMLRWTHQTYTMIHC